MLKEMGNEIDAVDICLPHHLHCEAILDSAAAGKSILCEKPMCMSLDEADKIADAVKRSGVKYMSAHNQLFMPVVQETKKMIEAGVIGRVLWLRSQDCFRAGGENSDAFKGSWRADLKTQGGGELIDTGYHPSYRLLHLAGSPIAAISGQMGRYVQSIQGEDTASVQIRFENGGLWRDSHKLGVRQSVWHAPDSRDWRKGPDLWLRKYTLSPARRFLRAGEANVSRSADFRSRARAFRRVFVTRQCPIHSVEEGRAVLELILNATKTAGNWRETAVRKV